MELLLIKSKVQAQPQKAAVGHNKQRAVPAASLPAKPKMLTVSNYQDQEQVKKTKNQNKKTEQHIENVAQGSD